MKKKLRRLLDYQKFQKNSRLSVLIEDTESRYAKELGDEELFFVNAAGDIVILDKKMRQREGINGSHPIP